MRQKRSILRVGLATLVLGVTCQAIGSSPVQAFTADGRGYEMVSAPDKNGGDVAGDGQSILAATDGNALTFSSRGSFGDTVGSGGGGQTRYLSRRTADGWVVKSITPTPAWNAQQYFLAETGFMGFSDDLRTAMVGAYDLPAVDGETPGERSNYYIEDTESLSLELVTASQVEPIQTIDFISLVSWGLSRDARHISFVAMTSRLLPEAPAGVPSVYEWSDGVLRLASILPNGSVATDGATIRPDFYRGMVSPDGRRVMFLSPPFGDAQLYARIDHAHTAWVSQPERTDGVPVTPQEVAVQEMTRDSRHVIFSTTSQLVDGDTNGGRDLYLFTDSPNPASDTNLTLVTDTGDLPERAVVGSSADGGRIYYRKDSGDLLLWDHGTTSVVTTDIRSAPAELSLEATAAAPGGARVTSDGRYLAFLNQGTPTGDGEHFQMYVYDAFADELRCISCPTGRADAADATVIPTVTNIFPRVALSWLRPSFLAADGRVFFSTPEALVSEDTNGLTDAYEYDPASDELLLLSTGRGSEPASFVDASESGDDVFIVTRQRLVGADRDAFVDVYDARIGGGFPEPAPLAPPCEEDLCQGAPASRPGRPAIGSGTTLDEAGRAARGTRVRLVRSRTLHGFRATLVARVPSAGAATWGGRGLRPGAQAFGAEGDYRIRVALTARARRHLAQRGVVRVALRLRFAPILGRPSKTTAALTFKSTKKGR